MAINGTKNTAVFFSGINKAVNKAAIITDHHGSNNDNRSAKTSVTIKFLVFAFISC